MLTGTSHISSRAASAWRSWGIPLAAIGALTALFGAVNWHWLQQNVVTYGWDRMDHLITSLVYNDMMRSFSPRTPFDLLSFSSYYPPLFHFNVVGLYRLFGVDEDVAAMANVGYLAILLGATWSIARRLAGSWTALLATFLLGAFPMIFAMSRYLYVDFALTSLVAASMACLLYGERFQRRGFSLCFGLALGFAFLTKWTAAAFLIGSLLYIVWRSGMWITVLRQPHLLLPNPRRAAIILTVSAGLNLLWLYPARDSVANSALGWWVYPVFTVMAAGALYALVAPDPPGQKDAACALRNGLRAAAVSAWLISLWYVLNPEFADYFAFTAYGREEPFMAFGKYFQEVAFEQVGPIFALLFAAVAIAWGWQQRGRFPATLRGLSDTAWVLVLWVAVPYFVFSFRVTLAHSRYVMPFLPPFAIWLAVGLAQWRPRWLRAVAIAGQWSLPSCSSPQSLSTASPAGVRLSLYPLVSGQ